MYFKELKTNPLTKKYYKCLCFSSGSEHKQCVMKIYIVCQAQDINSVNQIKKLIKIQSSEV